MKTKGQPVIIAAAGKGGTGKTTIIALIIKYLIEKGNSSILAIDADPNANLYQLLGIPSQETIADIIDETRDKQIEGLPGGMTKDRYIEFRLQDCLGESKDVDLLTMGRPEGQGCYCYANSLLVGHIQRLSHNYSFLVMDNEAGMEHLSRRTTRNVDFLIIVSDYSIVGFRSALRIHEVSQKLKLIVGKAGLIINRAPLELSASILKEITASNLPLWGIIPYDQNLPQYDLEQKPLLSLPLDSPSYLALKKTMNQLLYNNN